MNCLSSSYGLTGPSWSIETPWGEVRARLTGLVLAVCPSCVIVAIVSERLKGPALTVAGLLFFAAGISDLLFEGLFRVILRPRWYNGKWSPLPFRVRARLHQTSYRFYVRITGLGMLLLATSPYLIFRLGRSGTDLMPLVAVALGTLFGAYGVVGGLFFLFQPRWWMDSPWSFFCPPKFRADLQKPKVRWVVGLFWIAAGLGFVYFALAAFLRVSQ